MEQITYTFIIPHKNCPDLLQRCVDSIPERDDVQIIVVDDNSDEGKKPKIDRKNIEVILLDAEHSKGAGRARNVGLEHANGKWLLFADADDYYIEGFLDILDTQLDEELDVLYFNAFYLNRDGIEARGGGRLNKIIDKFDNSREYIDLIKYRIHVPWNKMVRKKYVDLYGFIFEEVPNGNDTMFSYQIGYFAQNIKVIPEKLYVYTTTPNSITRKRFTSDKCLSILSNIEKNKVFYDFIGHREWGVEGSVRSMVVKLVKRLSLYDASFIIYTYLTNKNLIKSTQNKYVDLVIQLKNKNL